MGLQGQGSAVSETTKLETHVRRTCGRPLILRFLVHISRNSLRTSRSLVINQVVGIADGVSSSRHSVLLGYLIKQCRSVTSPPLIPPPSVRRASQWRGVGAGGAACIAPGRLGPVQCPGGQRRWCRDPRGRRGGAARRPEVPTPPLSPPLSPPTDRHTVRSRDGRSL